MKISVDQGSVFLPLLFAIALDVIMKYARGELINKIFYADDFVFMSNDQMMMSGRR